MSVRKPCNQLSRGSGRSAAFEPRIPHSTGKNARLRPVFGRPAAAGSAMLAAMDSKQLFIEHLAGELQAMEVGRVPMNALRYRVHAKMLRKALIGASTPSLLERQGGAHPQVVHALSNRFFEDTGHLLQPNATAHKARSLLERTLATCRQARQK
jgi:hypothetical protein